MNNLLFCIEISRQSTYRALCVFTEAKLNLFECPFAYRVNIKCAFAYYASIVRLHMTTNIAFHLKVPLLCYYANGCECFASEITKQTTVKNI